MPGKNYKIRSVIRDGGMVGNNLFTILTSNRFIFSNQQQQQQQQQHSQWTRVSEIQNLA